MISIQVWELSDANISMIVEALGLHGYVALSEVAILPIWFKTIMLILFVTCFIWSVANNLRTTIAVGMLKYIFTISFLKSYVVVVIIFFIGTTQVFMVFY